MLIIELNSHHKKIRLTNFQVRKKRAKLGAKRDKNYFFLSNCFFYSASFSLISGHHRTTFDSVRALCTETLIMLRCTRACEVNLFRIKWKKMMRLLLRGEIHVPVSRANLRRRERCGSPLKFLHVQARPREIKFNGVWDEDLSWPNTRVHTVSVYVKDTCVRENLPRRSATFRARIVGEYIIYYFLPSPFPPFYIHVCSSQCTCLGVQKNYLTIYVPFLLILMILIIFL